METLRANTRRPEEDGRRPRYGFMAGSPGGWNDKIIDEFRNNAGKVGGYFEGAPRGLSAERWFWPDGLT